MFLSREKMMDLCENCAAVLRAEYGVYSEAGELGPEEDPKSIEYSHLRPDNYRPPPPQFYYLLEYETRKAKISTTHLNGRFAPYRPRITTSIPK